MSRPYEAVYIFDSTLEDTAINDKITRFHSLLGATADVSVDHWGRRQLAYKIGPRDTGYYVIARFAVDSGTLPEYERALKLDEGLLRYLITLHEHEVGAPPQTADALAVGRRRDDEEEDDD